MKRWICASMLAASAPAFGDEATAPSEPKSDRTGYFLIGAGYQSDLGFTAVARVGQSRLFGSRLKLEIGAGFNQLMQRFVETLELPSLWGGWTARATAVAERLQRPLFVDDALRLGLTLERKVGAWRVYGGYELEKHRIERSIDPILARDAPLGGALAGDDLLATLGGGVEYMTLDSRFAPTRGNRVHLWGQRADRRWGSDFDLVRGGLELEHAQPLGPLIVRVGGRASYVRTRDGSAVPLAYRLYGNGAVRGYGLLDGSPGGDTTSASGSVEVEFPVWRRAGLSIAAFHDTGLRHGPNGTLALASVGASILWRSPIGALRLDWAIPLVRADLSPVFSFGLGW